MCLRRTLEALCGCTGLRALCVMGGRGCFVGELPGEMASPPRLTSLQLYDCGFAGAPALPRLRELSVTDLCSALPRDCHVLPELTQLTALTALHTSRDACAGGLPASLVRLAFQAQAGCANDWLPPAEQLQVNTLAAALRRLPALRYLLVSESARLFPGGRLPGHLAEAISALPRLDSCTLSAAG